MRVVSLGRSGSESAAASPVPAKLPFTPPTSALGRYWRSEVLPVAPVSLKNCEVTTVTALPMSRRSVLRRLPASVVAAA